MRVAMSIVSLYTAGLKQPAVHLSTLFPKQNPGQATPLILLAHTLAFFPWKTRQRGHRGACQGISPTGSVVAARTYIQAKSQLG